MTFVQRMQHLPEANYALKFCSKWVVGGIKTKNNTFPSAWFHFIQCHYQSTKLKTEQFEISKFQLHQVSQCTVSFTKEMYWPHTISQMPSSKLNLHKLNFVALLPRAKHILIFGINLLSLLLSWTISDPQKKMFTVINWTSL